MPDQKNFSKIILNELKKYKVKNGKLPTYVYMSKDSCAEFCKENPDLGLKHEESTVLETFSYLGFTLKVDDNLSIKKIYLD